MTGSIDVINRIWRTDVVARLDGGNHNIDTAPKEKAHGAS